LIRVVCKDSYGGNYANGFRKRPSPWRQGCQIVYFQTENTNLGKFLKALDWKLLIHFIAFKSIYGHLGYFMTIRYILCSFGTFLPVLVSCTKKNLATLLCSQTESIGTECLQRWDSLSVFIYFFYTATPYLLWQPLPSLLFLFLAKLNV
jgi:hypothetical protein